MTKPQNKNLTRKNAPSTAEQAFSAMAATTGTTPETATLPDKPVIMLKRIGTTVYQVSVFTSNTSKETISDKVSRLIKNDMESEVVGV
ncbi:MAG: transposon-encoded TnpW family protein [Defluviitaleaceae bacterium]|nr:transposon-encoded TnpW family protein [Defluviitaleaceae bacterium]